MKHMKSLALLAVALIMPSAHAGKKMDIAKNIIKKTAKVSWHMAETALGVLAFIAGCKESLFHKKYQYAQDANEPDCLDHSKPLSTVGGLKKFATQRGFDDILCLSGGSIAAISLLNSGLKGLDCELKVVERCKKLYDRIKKGKKKQ